jgi:putative acetyltransferase
MNITVRPEREGDYPDIKRVIKVAFEKAFGEDKESGLVERLRKHPDFIPELSLVATLDSEVVGYILFFPLKIISDTEEFRSIGLAPMAVAPVHQRKGIGKKLIQEGLEKVRQSGYSSVIVLGHPEYYAKFGFKPARSRNIEAPFDVPDDAFLVMELVANGLQGVTGVVRYAKEFFEV